MHEQQLSLQPMPDVILGVETGYPYGVAVEQLLLPLVELVKLSLGSGQLLSKQVGGLQQLLFLKQNSTFVVLI